MKRALRSFFLIAILISATSVAVPVRADHGSADEASPNMLHIANLPPPPEFVECDRGSAACFNSDLAFWEGGGLKGGFTKILAQGNYEGFRLVDVSDPSNPTQISALECRTNQGDVSFYQARNRLLLIQSIEEQVSNDDCATAEEQPIVPGTNPVTNVPAMFRQKGHEGLRIFDVTRPQSPVHIATVRTACGSHTHTTIRDDRNQRAIVYVSSYPSGARVTRKEDLAVLPQQPNCIPDHNKISIVQIPDRAPETASVLKEQPLDEDTTTWSGQGNGGSPVRGCHDITVFEFSDSRKVAGAACLSEGQLWDVSDPANPTTNVPGRHSHIENLIIDDHVPPTIEGLFHTASFSWDGEVVLFTDEWGGGTRHGCDGPEDPRGNVWFYGNTPPGSVPPLFGRYILPRPQPAEEFCTMHNGNVIPTNEGYFGVSSAYQAGTSVFDFTGVTELDPIAQPPQPSDDIPTVATEVAFFDAKLDCHPEGPGNGGGDPGPHSASASGVEQQQEPSEPDPRCIDDAWSSYWHNDYIFASSGLPSGGRPGNRGLDVYLLLGKQGRLVDEEGNPAVTATNVDEASVQQYRARKFRYQNPQTQEVFQNLGR